MYIDEKPAQLMAISIVSTLLILGLFLFFCDIASADVDIDTIIQIESSGNPNAYNKGSQARGLMQITPICLKEYNSFNRASFNLSDLFVPEINIKIGTWYINKRIPQMLRYYKIEDTINNRLIAYNFGIGNLKNGVPLPKETRDYIKKYERRAK